MIVKPDTFARRMSEHWEAPPLSNVTSDRLEAAWADMANTFNRHIAGKVKNRWSVLQLPTGTGKTQGLSLYCSMLPKKDHPGVLIVTNLVDEAKIIEKDINDLSGTPGTALLCHAENKQEVVATIPFAPVLIVTHNAYKMSWEDDERDELYTHWKGGKRKLTVIDEALGVVEHYQVRIDELRFLRGVIPQHIANNFPNEIAIIDEAIERIVNAMQKKDEGKLIRFEHSASGFRDLLKEIRKLPLSAYVPGKIGTAEAGILKAGMIEKCRDVLRNLKAVASDWSVYSPSGTYYVLGTARFILPTDIKHAVVLDATVSESPLAKMLGKRFDIRPLPEGLKSYANARLHVSYEHDVSKSYLEQQGPEHFQALLDSLTPKISPKGRAFICVHKGNRQHFEHLSEKKYGIAHWYAINGSNGFKDCHAAIIYGLPYIGRNNATNALLSFLLWLRSIEDEDHDENDDLATAKKYATDYELRHIIVSIVQAVNRIRCRKISDDEGNCPEADIYLYLNKRARGKKIISAIKRLMPDINDKEWEAPRPEGDNEADTYTDNEQRLIDFFKNAAPRRYEFNEVWKKTGLSQREMQRHAPKLNEKRKGQTSLSRRLPQVIYYSKKGPKPEKYFIKAETTT